MSEERERTHFLREIIKEDLRTGKHERIVTRFPPEPNGYLHIGHAKAICISFGLADEFGGQCNLRFDDTNPETEKTEYVDNIQRDIRWLGFDWGDNLFFASDYFQEMYERAVKLIEQGKAYVDLSPDEVVRECRGTVTEAGRPTEYRDKSIAWSLEHFERMKNGEYDEGQAILRARIDLASPNMLMRDPLIYRVRKAAHHRTGTDWCIYPLYDWAHGLEDAIEGVTHSLCTLEFETHRELYDWYLDQIYPNRTNRQIEFARLSVDYLMTSKRKLKALVDEGVVNGWNDPRMPTLSGLRRRGVPAKAVRAFIDMLGVAKANSIVDHGKLDFAIRDTLNTMAPRRMAVLDPIELVLTNWPEGRVDTLTAQDWPHDVPHEGTREVAFGGRVLIERGDFAEQAPKGWHRLAPGAEVRLRYAYLITCDRVETDSDGRVLRLYCAVDLDSRGGVAADGRRVKGTLHWVSAEHGVPAEVRLYDRLFLHPAPGSEHDFREDINPHSLTVVRAVVEPSLAQSSPGERFQFERTGYFVREQGKALVFNRTIALKDSWSKKTSAAEPETLRRRPKGPPGPVRSRDEVRAEAHAHYPELAKRWSSLSALGVGDEVADAIAGDTTVFAFFMDGHAVHSNASTLANLVANDVVGAVGEGSILDLKFGGADLAQLVKLVDASTISSKQAKQVLGILFEQGGSPDAIVQARGMTQLSDPVAIRALVDAVMLANPDKVAGIASNPRLMGFFVGQVMKASKGRANPRVVNAVLREALS